MKKTLKETWSS